MLRTHPAAINWQGIAGVCLITITWLYLNLAALTWLYQSFRQASSFNLILISLVLVVVLVQAVRHRQQLEVSAKMSLRFYPLLLLLGTAVSAIALQWLVDIAQITVILFALGTYGLFGLFIAPTIWRRGLPVAALVAIILPFLAQAGTGLGFPVRVLTARVVEQLLMVGQIAAVSSHDIIVLENGIAHVDLPCSGLRSLWTSTLFLLALTWLETRRIGIKWFVVCGASLLLQVGANTMRVLILVLVTHVLHQPTYAQILHLPLGLLGFICACGLSWAMLQTVPRHQDRVQDDITTNQQSDNPKSQIPNPKWTALLLACLVTLALIPRLPASSTAPLSLSAVPLPANVVWQPLTLTAAEQRVFPHTATAKMAQKQRFTTGELSGSLLLVSSNSWATYHPPELCFVGNGLKVDRMEKAQLTPEILGRWLSLQDGKLSATYWFQSPTLTTDDFISRLWSQITRRQQKWVLISVLFDQHLSPDDAEVLSFATTIRNAIHHSLNGAEL